MGSDKGLLTTDGIPWAIRMGEKLAPWGIPVVYSVNKGQFETYTKHLPGRTLVVDSLGLAGPMEGLLTVHSHYPQNDLLLLACDLQDLDELTLSGLIESYVADGARQSAAYGYMDAEGLQPLCTIYTSVLLRSQYAVVMDGGAIDVRLRSLLTREGTRILATMSDTAFRNYNTL
jgi:molybdopterin-guanine dinucleotide biosynthesis protein A